MDSFDRFPIRVRPREGEPAIAALGRTSLRMGLGSERELAAMFGLRLNDVARGSSNARLASLMGHDCAATNRMRLGDNQDETDGAGRIAGRA